MPLQFKQIPVYLLQNVPKIDLQLNKSPASQEIFQNIICRIFRIFRKLKKGKFYHNNINKEREIE